MRRIILIISLLVFSCVLGVGLSHQQTERSFAEETGSVKETWADSVLKTLRLEEKIAQLMIIRAHSDKTADYNASLLEQIKKYQ